MLRVDDKIGLKKSFSAIPPDNNGGESTRKRERLQLYRGGSSGNPGRGYGAVKISNGREKNSQVDSAHNKQPMELMGHRCLRSLEKRDEPITLYTDSSYVVNGITKGWAEKWRKNNWIKSDKQPAINPDLWGELLNLIEPLNIKFMWVKGHAGNIYNERCDELAVSSSKKPGLPEDKGYKG
jgi:ribonuclease HI